MIMMQIKLASLKDAAARNYDRQINPLNIVDTRDASASNKAIFMRRLTGHYGNKSLDDKCQIGSEKKDYQL